MICLYKKQIGFSLIELVVVCLLISILLGIGIPSYMNSRYKADKQKAVFNLYAIYQAQKEYYFDQDPPTYAFTIFMLTPNYAELSMDDGSWTYQVTAFGGNTYTVTANHKLSNGVFDGYWISIDDTGSINDAVAHWPY